tara:strand:+ start:409 stop:822 length:414 start_codon:yes stop_codon:yes gene_type:complete
MKLTVKLEYALRALAALTARYESGEVCCIDEMADREAIPANYLVQILRELRNGGLVVSKRGKQGGYLLGRAPEEISLRDVVALVQGDWFQGAASKDGLSGERVAAAWGQLQKSFEDTAKSITLRDLATSPAKAMYYI